MTEKKKEKVKCVCHTRGNLKAISFHSDVKGNLITLSEGGRRVSRDGSSFCHGLAFSGRRVVTDERLRVERRAERWHGALRVGFTHISPEQTTVPPLAIPDLTHSPLNAAVIVPEEICRPGTEIRFWLKKNGCLRILSSDGIKHTEPTNLNAKWPVWALVDVYGQTTAVTMLGSMKKHWLFTSRSCPAATHTRHTEENDIRQRNQQMSVLEQRNLTDHCTDNIDHDALDCEECVVCYNAVANSRLSCGHKCVCTLCAMRVYLMFGTCPLCRKPLGSFHLCDR